MVNAERVEEVVFGSSSMVLFENLARAMVDNVHEGEEIVITGEHEANAGPWKRLAARTGAVLKLWRATPLPDNDTSNPYAVGLQLSTLLPHISAQTRLVAFTACSNILGSLLPVASIVRAARSRASSLGASKLEFCIDCVAYAPHRPIDVRAWDVDYCAFSFYKVYGPHVGVMYVRARALEALGSLAHHFLDVDTEPYKLQPGGPGYELVYGCTAVPEYIKELTLGGTLEGGWAAIAEHEQTLIEPLFAYLRSRRERGVRIVGDEKAGMSRVPTVSFAVVGERAMSSKAIVGAFDAKGDVGIRYGHFYAYTLVYSLVPKIDVKEGVVRISLVHYNTAEEVERLVDILDEVLA